MLHLVKTESLCGFSLSFAWTKQRYFLLGNMKWSICITNIQYLSGFSGGIMLVSHSEYGWDEWVNSGRLLEPTPENMQKVCRDKKKDVRGKKQKKNPSSIRDKRKRDDAMDKGKDSVPLEKLVNISIPPSLKKQLMDDCESINQMGKLVKLPRAPNVNDIIEKYRDYRGKKDDVIPHSVGEVLSGLLIYFNNALPVMLLYNKEREQYQEAINDKISPAEIYGAEHLLRLFVKLPTLLYKVEIDEEALRELQQTLHDFLKFLQKNQGVFFLSTYHVPEATEGGIDKDCD